MAEYRNNFGKFSGWVSLCLFLLAYVAPELPLFHVGHHLHPSAAADQGNAGAAWTEVESASHNCLACLWKSQRESQSDDSRAEQRLGNSAASGTAALPPESSPSGISRFSSPARAPPARV